ncbi:poly-gamma-glutamate biosynthesis protein PgsC [Tissierellaceae bacterium BX21]|uniref:Poly-gamma-glutamate biosynthesis protein PgsC n=2 Tax=Paratissierella segnis TaxID=2763679 RepID=A0A926ESK1_9FIRM|nr:poly-gamma-glutamate biosynthesis protein PgsC [Paratissierella segnis]
MSKECMILGILLSIIYYELTEISPGGLIVPGYIALYINSPEKIFYTLIISILTFLIVKVIGSFAILYGKRRFAIMILFSFIIKYFIGLFHIIPGNLDVIGYLIPGIIAQDFEKQGIFNTIISLSIVVAILVLILLLFNISVF